ncbi:hypothetical protein [Treponema socranskii]|uniref:hypothetical protein n=1 Tax=Treponema socranskii TaxID=53419 RepID=UPI003D8B1F45
MRNTASFKNEPYSRLRRAKNIFRDWFMNPYNLLVIASIIVLLFFVVVPLLEMVFTSFQVDVKDVSRIKKSAAGDWTLYYWKRLLNSVISKNMLYRPH